MYCKLGCTQEHLRRRVAPSRTPQPLPRKAPVTTTFTAETILASPTANVPIPASVGEPVINFADDRGRRLLMSVDLPDVVLNVFQARGKVGVGYVKHGAHPVPTKSPYDREVSQQLVDWALAMYAFATVNIDKLVEFGDAVRDAVTDGREELRLDGAAASVVEMELPSFPEGASWPFAGTAEPTADVDDVDSETVHFWLGSQKVGTASVAGATLASPSRWRDEQREPLLAWMRGQRARAAAVESFVLKFNGALMRQLGGLS